MPFVSTVTRRRARGATLAELLIVLGCTAVLVLAGARAFGISIDDKVAAQAACVASLGAGCGGEPSSESGADLSVGESPDALQSSSPRLARRAQRGSAGSGGPVEPTFEVYDDTFVPRDKEPWLDAMGIQRRPIEVLVDRQSYQSLIDNGYTPEAFLDAHADRMNDLLAAAGINMRVYIAEIRYVETVTNDQRGPWAVRNSGNWPLTTYDAATLPGADGIEMALIHEWGHSVLGLWDDYGFDVHVASATDVFEVGATPEHPDSVLIHEGPQGLMNSNDAYFSDWVVPLLNARAAADEDYRPHEAVAVTADDLSTETTLTFDDWNRGYPISVYQTEGIVGSDDNSRKQLSSTPVLTGSVSADGTFVIDAEALFADILAQPNGSGQSNESRTASGVVMITVGGPSGPEQYWLDLTDFVYAQQQATAASSDEVVIDLPPRSR
jgi:hypothetical protein